jgi:hypothetical protein
MMRLPSFLRPSRLLFLGAALGGCSAQGLGDDPSSDPSPRVLVTEEVGGPGSAPSALGGTAEQALPGATPERPCGAATVANLRLANGNQLSFCVLPGGTELFQEVGPHGRTSFLAEMAAQPACGLDVYLAATGAGAAVPAALVDACPTELRPAALAARPIVAEGVFDDAPDQGIVPRTNYCVASAATFVAERCYVCNPYDDCYDWCVSDAWGWHSRTMSYSNFLGEEGNIAMETNAACGSAPTRVRGYTRDDYDDAFGTPSYDYWLNSGYWNTNGMIRHSIAVFGQDYDFRLRADSNAGGWHRHTGYFFDE